MTKLFKEDSEVKRILWMLFVVVALVAYTPVCSADVVLTDQNSSLSIDTDNSAGAWNWTVDGVNHLFQQWFWYRIGNNAEQTIDTLSAPAEVAVGNIATITYAGGGLQVKITYVLSGSTAGQQTSDLGEIISLKNTGGAPMDLHFFQYSDFDLNGVSGGQSVLITGAPPNTAVQQGGGIVMAETAVVSAPNRYEAGIWPATFNKLTNGVADNLNNVASAGPGDATWAFQWDATLAANGGTFLISKNKKLDVIPEPTAILLLGTGLLLIGRRFRKIA
jgi:hypothetical protein